MRKTYRLRDLDCANCAAKMERGISKIPGVQSASISFMTQRLTIEADEPLLDSIIKQAVKVCRKIEPDCTILL
ncbi:MAG: heavy-metal-associated domain-containing protein [Intestinimonas sp.]|jgi:copper chaperone CopZ|nr:heavy-metal-associated domain-containing protein [Intestinimonas sp.]